MDISLTKAETPIDVVDEDRAVNDFLHAVELLVEQQHESVRPLFESAFSNMEDFIDQVQTTGYELSVDQDEGSSEPMIHNGKNRLVFGLCLLGVIGGACGFRDSSTLFGIAFFIYLFG